MREHALPTPTVAFIGLGQMGRHMATHVASAGFALRAFDVSNAAMAEVPRAATRATSPADAASGADVICIVVFDDDQVWAVLDGATGVLGRVKPGAIIAVHSTVRVDSVHEFARAAEAAGASLLDAGISGGEAGARAAALVTMVGGTPESVEIARPVLDTFSQAVVHAGPLGCGMSMKLVRNLVGYMLSAATSEGIALARAAGLDLDQLEQVLRATSAANEAQLFAPFARSSGAAQARNAGAGSGADAAKQRAHGLALATKDLTDALALAEAIGVALPIATETFSRYVALQNLT